MKEITSTLQWHKYPEEMPENSSHTYLVAVNGCAVYPAYFSANGNRWRSAKDGTLDIKKVDFWSPLPEYPREV